MLRRVEDQGRVQDGEAERRENLNEEQRGRSLRNRGEKAFERFHPALICRSTRRVMSSGSQARTLRREAASLFASRSREADDSVLVKTGAPAMLAASLLQVCARVASAFPSE